MHLAAAFEKPEDRHLPGSSSASLAFALPAEIALVHLEFTVAHGSAPGIKILDIDEPTDFQTYVAVKAGKPLSRFAETFIAMLRQEMVAVTRALTGAERPLKK